MTEPNERAPLGSWARLYGLVAACAVVVTIVLYWLTTSFNIPLPS